MTVTGEDNSLGTDPLEPPLMAPLLRGFGWDEVQRMSQSAAYRDDVMLQRIARLARRARLPLRECRTGRTPRWSWEAEPPSAFQCRPAWVPHALCCLHTRPGSSGHPAY